ncbi:MAG: DUF1343 domain-containing protein, partial [Deltaproteobacteria bacterium]|nr:DUF1343 domain-containing protein [Deltaproteobacteria bacterium]
MRVGLDLLPDHLLAHHRGARVGLLCHSASIACDGRHAAEILAANSAWRLATFFGPEHGVAGLAQDLEGVSSTTDPATGLPSYSLYGDSFASLTPTTAMLRDIDLMVIDLQDIGARYYTYIWTTALCMKACSKAGKIVIVCDRPNPINGLTIEGPFPLPGYESFVGLYPLPVRHGMTIGEIARYCNWGHRLGAQLEVVPMDGWRREWYWDETGLPWRNPSPNMRSLTAALLYPGACLLEATNIAEGRGTNTPFEQCGAPWIDGDALADQLRELSLPGIAFASTEFTPTARKYAGQLCHGVRFTIADRATFRPYEFGLALLHVLATHHLVTRQPQRFRWRDPYGTPPDDGPYEFAVDLPAIDLLTGSSRPRAAIDRGAKLPEI